MENQKVTLESIRRKASNNLLITTIFISLLLIVCLFILLVITNLNDYYKQVLIVIIFFSILKLNIGAWVLGRYSKHFQKKTAINWYNWDVHRTDFFERKKEEYVKISTELLDTKIENFLKIECAKSSNNTIKEKSIKNFENVLRETFLLKEKITLMINNDDYQTMVITLIQCRDKIKKDEESFTEAFLDLQNLLNRKSKLFKKNFTENIKKQDRPIHEGILKNYDDLIESCKKSKIDLKFILKEKYNFEV